MKPRPCGCKGCRTCKVCETQYGATEFKVDIQFDKNKGYVYCPHCDVVWKGWDLDTINEHPNHTSDKLILPGVYIKLDFITEEEENILVHKLDEIPWDVSQSGRRKQNFGPKTNFKKRKLKVGNFDGFPQFSKYLQDRIQTVDLLNDYKVIEQCSLEYDPSKGASIDPHIDDCWIWGERIVTVNCLSDSVLTMIPYKGNIKKYNLDCAKNYPPIISNKAANAVPVMEDINAFEASKPSEDKDVVIRIPMPRRSLILLYGEARYHWEHCVLREDIGTRRICLAYREFTPPYLSNGIEFDIGKKIIEQAGKFWDHKVKYNLC